jgi:hypothetical protein
MDSDNKTSTDINEIMRILDDGIFEVNTNEFGNTILLKFRTNFGYETTPISLSPIVKELRQCLEFNKALKEYKKITNELEDLSSTEWR